jgi:hypothetical protein
MHPEVLREHIQKCKKATDNPFGVNVPLMYPEIETIMNILVEEGVKIVFTSAGSPKKWTGFLKKHDVTVVHVVSSALFAAKCEEAGVDAIELGYWSRIRLIRQVFRNMLYAGATELVTEVGMDLLGAELTAKLSARAAQGVGAGLLTARLGMRTMEACRPLPWCADEKPKVGELRKRLIGQLAGYLNKS